MYGNIDSRPLLSGLFGTLPMPKDSAETTAILYRMVMKDHMCPYGLKAKDLLERNGFVVDEHVSRAASVDAEHAQMDHAPNPVNSTHSETCRVHVACSLAAMSVQPNLAIALPLSKTLSLPLYDLVQPSALSLTETPPPRA